MLDAPLLDPAAEHYEDTVSATSTVLGSALSLRFDDSALEHEFLSVHALKTAPKMRRILLGYFLYSIVTDFMWSQSSHVSAYDAYYLQRARELARQR